MEIKRPFSAAEWLQTPEAVRAYIEMLEQSILKLSQSLDELKKRTEKLEQRVSRNSQNSNQPPSADGPFKKPERKKKKGKRKRGGQKGHTGHRQQLLDPTETVPLKPSVCSCGSPAFDHVEPYYTHQQIELPEIELEVTHYVLYKGCCSRCGRSVSAKLDPAHRTGYGPRMSALIAELSGMQAVSRKSVQQFLSSVLGISISTGAIQKVIDRVSGAIEPAYERIGQVARADSVGYVDETSWFKTGKLHWLWVMVTAGVALYLVHPRRSREAFNELIQQWQGILVSDNYPVFVNAVIVAEAFTSHHPNGMVNCCKSCKFKILIGLVSANYIMPFQQVCFRGAHMIRVFHKTEGLWQEVSIETRQNFSKDCIWVDLISPTLQEIEQVQTQLNIEIPSRAEMQEIEETSRLYRENNTYFMTASIITNPDIDHMEVSAITFILADRFLSTVRYLNPKPFDSFAIRLKRSGSPFSSSIEVMIGLLETLIDRMADILEFHSAEVERIAKLIFTGNDKHSATKIDHHETLKDIGMEGNQFSTMRESLVSINRMANYMNLAVAHHPKNKHLREMLKEISRDLASLADHTSFMSSKINFLLDATLGMINIEQNEIIRLLSVAAVFFLPPTLIASIYGMNFQFMPELSSKFGYPLVILLMITSSFISYLYFKRKGWM